MREAACPACGSPVSFRSSVALLTVCPHCRTQLVRKDLDLSALGKAADILEDGSVVQLGSEGRWQGVGFSVAGRLQMRFDDGFWNEWFLVFGNGDQGWLGEAQGVYCVSFKRQPDAPLPAFGSLAVGQRLAVMGQDFEVSDLRTAAYLSAEGELPFAAPLGESAPLADLSAPGGAFATLDYSEEPPLLFLGRYASPEDLSLTKLRVPEGW